MKIRNYNPTEKIDPLSLRTEDFEELKNKMLEFDINKNQKTTTSNTIKGTIEFLQLPPFHQDLPLFINIIDELGQKHELNIFDIKNIRVLNI